MSDGQQPGAKHTPGGWHLRVLADDPDMWAITADFCESPLALVPRWKDEAGADSPEALANLLLIKAAPRLLAALRLLLDRTPAFLTTASTYADARAESEAVIGDIIGPPYRSLEEKPLPSPSEITRDRSASTERSHQHGRDR
jgi:hypothetical protein